MYSQIRKHLLWLFIPITLLLGCDRLQAILPGQEATQTPVVVTAVVTPTPELVISQPTPTPLSAADLAPIDVEEDLIASLYERVSPSVVHITAQIMTLDFFFGPMSSEGTGSGFVWDETGHIITNYHVIEDAEQIEVIFSDETQVPASIVGVDPENDLAVLRVAPTTVQMLPMELGASADLRVGQRAIAIGNPFGLDRTLTTGVISALGGPLETDQNNFIFNVVQTDAAINPGNSGGPLLNSRGQVIGINTAIREGAEGIGFAVPVDTLRRVVPVLIAEGRYPHPTLGLLGYSITPRLAETLQLPVERGILVAQLYRDGPALAAGMRGAQQEAIIGNQRILVGGDIVVAIDNQPIPDWNRMLEYLELHTQVGQTVILSLLRDGQPLELELTLAADSS